MQVLELDDLQSSTYSEISEGHVTIPIPASYTGPFPTTYRITRKGEEDKRKKKKEKKRREKKKREKSSLCMSDLSTSSTLSTETVSSSASQATTRIVGKTVQEIPLLQMEPAAAAAVAGEGGPSLRVNNWTSGDLEEVYPELAANLKRFNSSLSPAWAATAGTGRGENTREQHHFPLLYVPQSELQTAPASRVVSQVAQEFPQLPSHAASPSHSPFFSPVAASSGVGSTFMPLLSLSQPPQPPPQYFPPSTPTHLPTPQPSTPTHPPPQPPPNTQFPTTSHPPTFTIANVPLRPFEPLLLHPVTTPATRPVSTPPPPPPPPQLLTLDDPLSRMKKEGFKLLSMEPDDEDVQFEDQPKKEEHLMKMQVSAHQESTKLLEGDSRRAQRRKKSVQRTEVDSVGGGADRTVIVQGLPDHVKRAARETIEKNVRSVEREVVPAGKVARRSLDEVNSIKKTQVPARKSSADSGTREIVIPAGKNMKNLEDQDDGIARETVPARKKLKSVDSIKPAPATKKGKGLDQAKSLARDMSDLAAERPPIELSGTGEKMTEPAKISVKDLQKEGMAVGILDHLDDAKDSVEEESRVPDDDEAFQPPQTTTKKKPFVHSMKPSILPEEVAHFPQELLPLESLEVRRLKLQAEHHKSGEVEDERELEMSSEPSNVTITDSFTSITPSFSASEKEKQHDNVAVASLPSTVTKSVQVDSQQISTPSPAKLSADKCVGPDVIMDAEVGADQQSIATERKTDGAIGSVARESSGKDEPDGLRVKEEGRKKAKKALPLPSEREPKIGAPVKETGKDLPPLEPRIAAPGKDLPPLEPKIGAIEAKKELPPLSRGKPTEEVGAIRSKELESQPGQLVDASTYSQSESLSESESAYLELKPKLKEALKPVSAAFGGQDVVPPVDLPFPLSSDDHNKHQLPRYDNNRAHIAG